MQKARCSNAAGLFAWVRWTQVRYRAGLGWLKRIACAPALGRMHDITPDRRIARIPRLRRLSGVGELTRIQCFSRRTSTLPMSNADLVGVALGEKDMAGATLLAP
ncbi:hypothetical protein [Ralstonia sp. ASV6]|uniref:hypothetical protein n=1 Tax=Ralstonia sp. ASV6 TaxID=2795124 RepID=UPI0018ED6BA2|nr:hypothetical protein [Ralstonia sp. ASV6]